MEKVRYYIALGIRVFAFIVKLPSAILYDLSDLIKNKGDKFTF